MTGGVSAIGFAPLLPWGWIAALASVALLMAAVAGWRGLRGWPLRLGAALVLAAALAGPTWRVAHEEPLRDLVLLMTDGSGSNRIGARGGRTAAAADRLAARIAPLAEVRRVTIPDGGADEGTPGGAALSRALSALPMDRLAGVVLLTDGQFADAPALPQTAPAPVTTILTGARADWDRRLHVTRAPSFGLIGQETRLAVRIDEAGVLPKDKAGAPETMTVAVDGAPRVTLEVRPGAEVEVPIKLTHAGVNVVQLSIPMAGGELTDLNNSEVVTINGVRDRLRVLLVSGEPYAGERTWRNLLKSDPSVDLVHFTILRPPEKDDGVPVNELALIAFPTHELFVEKIRQFDLIIFDRFAQRGTLEADYIASIADYVRAGGAVLLSAGPDYASAESLYHSALGSVLPAAPDSRVVEGAFLPRLTRLGDRHPVTAGLWHPDRPWGRWLRHVGLTDVRGQAVMETPDGAPLLVLDRVGEGRVALLATDQAWLWARGFEGGGPQAELLRRLAHWSMREPDLEEEALTASVGGAVVTITRRTMGEGPRSVTVTGPNGAPVAVPLTEGEPGRFSSVWTAPAPGLYRMAEGGLTGVFAVGAAQPREYADPVATGAALTPLAKATGGSVHWIEDGIPEVRAVRSGDLADGRGWIGITPRGASRVLDLRQVALLPDWLALLLALGLMVGAWTIEGRRRQPPA